MKTLASEDQVFDPGRSRVSDNEALQLSGGSAASIFRNFTCRHSMNGGVRRRNGDA